MSVRFIALLCVVLYASHVLSLALLLHAALHVWRFPSMK